jgi:TrmH family RNA methyltransferase
MSEEIQSRTNPLVKQIRALRTPRRRPDQELFLVEGIHPVGEAVEAGWKLEALLYAPRLLTSDFGRSLVETAARRGERVASVAPELFSELSDKDNPQGILALVHRRSWTLAQLEPVPIRLGVALVSPQDPGNVGTILRCLDGVGADALIELEGGVDPFHPSSVRASMGTIFWKPVVQAGFQKFVEWTRGRGIRLVGSSAHAELNCSRENLSGTPSILLLGSEQKGLTREQQAACDRVVSIPMHGRASSLNLAVAAGILLYLMEDTL